MEPDAALPQGGALIGFAPAAQHLALALGLGLLIGLQRERVKARLAGVRTFPLVAVLGTLCAMLADPFGGWTVAAGLLGVALLLYVGNIVQPKHAEGEFGLTTEVAMLVTFAIGALVHVTAWEIPIALGSLVAVLLHLKKQLHGFTARLAEQDVRAIMQFVVVTFVILPVLPDRPFGPLGVLNPFRIWLMVVLIVSISLGGYVAFAVFGARVGAFVSGLLGGLVSSTATTFSAARACRSETLTPAAAAAMVITASAIVHPRVLLELLVVSPPLAHAALVPMGALFATNLVAAGAAWMFVRRNAAEVPKPGNPTEIGGALAFAAVYALVLLGTKAASAHLGEGGLLGVAVVVGLTDVDAITLSMASLVESGSLAVEPARRAVVLAVLANLAFKVGVVGAVGTRGMLVRVAFLLGGTAAAGAAALAMS